MKETVNANIGQQIFTLDRDAYDYLFLYLNNVHYDTYESKDDIEFRLAMALREMLSSYMMVVTLDMAEQAINRIGRAENFSTTNRDKTKNNNNMGYKLLRRSRTNRSIAGVCGGLANYLGIDATPLRIATLLLILFGGMSLWVYIIMWLLIPEE